MTELQLEQLKYPIGKFTCPDTITEQQLKLWILALELLPERVNSLVSTLTSEQLETPYRPGGWTLRQLIHHIADSHHHSYTRFKWALTEDEPLIKAYEEKDWSALFDARTAPIALSLTYLVALHAKLVYMLKGLPASDLKKVYLHPEGKTRVSVAENVGKYAWHGNHHLAQIKGLINRMNW
ncbi:putative metal-dependent hydrolase [Cellulophaga sp. E16_2]|uniref:YfiT family bacillithiol transferase n=1 Tax=Cellulophaga sp. E16_2 TaxID=2789297 RepID=UPI001A91CE3C|nr:putative metal-dependent hydrolase [Cellulophaga sp. E16_2]MBO0590067.1 putative metal-dependent hydrolase [Cellulophaga sp. E16_2]